MEVVEVVEWRVTLVRTASMPSPDAAARHTGAGVARRQAHHERMRDERAREAAAGDAELPPEDDAVEMASAAHVLDSVADVGPIKPLPMRNPHTHACTHARPIPHSLSASPLAGPRGTDESTCVGSSRKLPSCAMHGPSGTNPYLLWRSVAGEGDCTKTREELRRELEIGLRRI